MNDSRTAGVLFSESEIAARVAQLAGEIACLDDPPDLAVPILVGGFVFAADLLRALDARGLSLAVEFLRLRSYANKRAAERGMTVLLGPGDAVAGRHVLLVDGVLDRGHTLKRARELVFTAGARAVTTAVVVDKTRETALLRANFAAFAHVAEFVVGYGMDDAGRLRSLPYIGVAEAAE